MKHGHFSHDQGKRLQRCRKRQRSPNQALQPTALGADKIEAILEAGFSSIAFLIYSYAAAEAYAVGRHEREKEIKKRHHERLSRFMVYYRLSRKGGEPA